MANLGTKKLSLLSPAKINLSLRVGNKLPNGLHQIVTTIAPIAVCDDVHLELLDEGSSTCNLRFGEELASSLGLESAELIVRRLSSIEKNIAAKAVATILEGQSFELTIEKNIPIEAGLGGGSGNAATGLLLANQLRKTPLPFAELVKIASSLGSDIGPMLYRSPVIQSTNSIESTSIAKEVEGMDLLLIKPPSGTSTREAYIKLDRPEVDPYNPEFVPTFAIENDFEEVFFLEDWFQEGSQCLLELDAQRVLLCGSGSTIVGFFEPGRLSGKSLLEARNQLNNWWVYQTRFWS